MIFKNPVKYCFAAACFAVIAANASKPTAANALYTQTALAIAPVGSCIGENAGCNGIQGIDWLSDGRMVALISDWQNHGNFPTAPRPGSKVTLVSGLSNGGPITMQDIATNFKFPTGLTVVNDRIYVADMDSFYVIPSNAGNNPSTNRQRKFQMPTPLTTGSNPLGFGFAMGDANTSYWHRYVFTPVYFQGKFYANYSGATATSGPSNVRPASYFDGAVLGFDTNTTLLDTNVHRAAAGLRSANGGNLGPNGQILAADNQGSWLPMCYLVLVKPFTNQFFGYRQSSTVTASWGQAGYAAGRLKYVPPVAVMDFAANGWRSLSQPLYLSSGPYAGDWLVGDVYSTGIARVAFDSLADTTGTPSTQAAVFWFANSTGNDAINRLSQGPDGSIYAGVQRSIGNWPMGASTNIMYKYSRIPNASQFEIRKVRSVADGFELYLSQPAAPASVIISNFTVQQKSWVRQEAYGGGAGNYVTRTVTAAGLSNDGLRIHLTVGGIQRINQSKRGDTTTHWVTKFAINNLTSTTGGTNFTNEATYAQNWSSTRVWNAAEPTPIATYQKISQLEKHVGYSTDRGVLRVNVGVMKPYRALLRDLQGRILAQQTGSGPGQLTFKSPGRTHALYVMEVRSGSEVYSKVVIF